MLDVLLTGLDKYLISAISSNGIVSNMGPEGFSKIGAGKDTLPALPVIFQIGAGMVGPEWYRAGTSETLFFSSLSLSHTEKINRLDPNLKIPEMKTGP
jgi:hypothetical protein